MATSNIAGGGANEIDTVFRPYESETVKVGIRVPILYLRTTKGSAGDYAFDADFPSSRKCGARTIAEDNLHGVIDYAVKHRLPVLFTLNGGIWADAACDVPEWDITDTLEQDIANCQWNEKNQAMPDDYLKNLSGSMDSPELGRALTFNIYAANYRHYKKRNLQQAASIIREFAAQHPTLFIGVNLDPDLYVNPFFEGQQWYDYNPGTLRQFREWLQGSGPYSGRIKAGEPDLSRYKRKTLLTLAEVNALSGRQFKHWEDVDPPRTFPIRLKPFWEDAWVAEWEHFRRHLVDLHYDELSQWVGEAGIGKEFIYSAQGFMAPGSQISPFPVHVGSTVKNYDTGGMSVEGAIPSNGHLGAILYGPSAVNQIKMEGERSLFSVFRKLDPGWGVVEHNTADLRNPARLPDFGEAYRSLRDIHNYGARFISPMAWNGSRGILAGQPGFVSYMSLRDTPLEDAIKNFMVSHANLPRRARLWTFGTERHADSDGWVAVAETQASVGPGMLTLRSGANGKGTLESPDDLAFRPADYRAIIIKAGMPEALASMGVDGQMADGKWATLIPMTETTRFQRVNAGLLLPLAGEYGDTEFRRIRLNWIAAGNEPLELQHIAFTVTGTAMRQSHLTEASSPCNARGSVDKPKVINSGTRIIEGWAADAAGISRVEMWVKGSKLGSVKPGIDRPDVRASLPQCNFPAASGYRFNLNAKAIPPSATEMEIRAVNAAGKTFTVSRVPVDFSNSAGKLDIAKPDEAGTRNGATKTHPAPPLAAIGFVDELSEVAANRAQTRVIGWALAKDGVDRVELVLNGQFRVPLQIAVARPDVAQICPTCPDSAKAGFDGVVDTSRWVANWHTMEVIVTDKKGRSSVIGRRTRPAINAMDTWNDLLKARGVKRDDVFYFIMATSNLANGGAKEIDTVFRPYESETVKVGMRVPILYLRTTKGKAGDYAFDPDFPLDKKCGQRTLAEDNLNGVIDYAVAHKLPVLFTLNGGIWADAACDVQDWDINDMLEQDVANCQWNQKNEVLPDSHLKQLSGSIESPELARSLSFNVYAEKNRYYKKRNLQQAAARIRAFAIQHPDLFVGVTLDPDTYINPFFDGQQWYDFNPGTLRQFREWLQGRGPYANRAKQGQLGRSLQKFREWLQETGSSASRPRTEQPDLSRYRKQKPLTLEQVNSLSGAHFKTWDEVDPPRSIPTVVKNAADNPWVVEWEHFRRHLVALHYEELSQWVNEAGIDKESIYSGQGFMAPGKSALPFAIHINSPLKNYDTGGMSVEGAIPSNGHLGAILYGPSAANQIRMEDEHSLFSTFRKLDPGWAVIEHNTADLHEPARLPDFAEAYRSLREIHNYGARFISPMAWNGSRGIFAGQAGFVSYTALRDSPLEDAIKMFMISHANLPRRSRLWTFGAGAHADGDGWAPSENTQGQLAPGRFTLRTTPGSQGLLESPDDMAFKPSAYRAIIIKATKPEVMTEVGVEGQTQDGKWVVLLATTDLGGLQRVSAGLMLPLAGPGDTEYRRIRLNWKAVGSEPLVLERIAFYAN